MNPTKILVIHDGWSKDEPIMIELYKAYGRDNVTLENCSSKTLKIIKEKQGEKIIILLDFDLGEGEPHAPEVLNEIRKYTALIYVIVVTAKQFSEIKSEDLVNFINNDAFAIIQNTSDMKDIIALTKKAEHVLDTSVDCVLEQWISRRTKEDINAPYLTTPEGESYSLLELQNEIRHQTLIGMNLEKSILHLAIELIGGGGSK